MKIYLVEIDMNERTDDIAVQKLRNFTSYRETFETLEGACECVLKKTFEYRAMDWDDAYECNYPWRWYDTMASVLNIRKAKTFGVPYTIGYREKYGGKIRERYWFKIDCIEEP